MLVKAEEFGCCNASLLGAAEILTFAPQHLSPPQKLSSP